MTGRTRMGEDVYFPDVVKLRAYDVEISVVYKGARGSFPVKQESLFKYLTTNGSELNIYSRTHIRDVRGLTLKGSAILILRAM